MLETVTRAAGDLPGHEFHGNQYVTGTFGPDAYSTGGLAVSPRDSHGVLPPHSVLASFTDNEGYSIRIVGGTPKGYETAMGVRRLGTMRLRNPEGKTIQAGYWMDFPEPSWGLSDKEYKSLSWEKRAALQVEHEAKNYGGLKTQYNQRSLDTLHPSIAARFLTQLVLRRLGDVEGHPFHGNQWTSSTDFFHGTRVEAARKIKTEGLLAKHGAAYVSSDLRFALGYALNSSQKDHVAIVVVKGEAAKFFKGTEGTVSWTSRKIPPEYIKEVRVYKSKDIQTWQAADEARFKQGLSPSNNLPEFKTLAAGDLYIVIPLDDDEVQALAFAQAVGPTVLDEGDETRALASHPETPLHLAADSQLKRMKTSVHYALALARSRVRPSNPAQALMTVPSWLEVTLVSVLPATLLKCVEAGGVAAVEMLAPLLRAAGDLPGHEFHGNQWTQVAVSKKTQRAADKAVFNVTVEEPFKKFVDSDEERHEWLQALGNALHTDQNDALRTVVKHRDSVRFEDARRVYTVSYHSNALIPHEQIVGTSAGRSYLLLQIERKPQLKNAADLTMRFDVSDPKAVQWAKDHAAELAKGISETTRDAIKAAIADALETGENAYHGVLDAIGDETRAELIARTETMRAASEGQRLAWDQAVDKGLLTGDERRVWITTEGACPNCEPLDGKTAALDGEYPDDGGDGPPLHPRCRCTEGISEKS